MESSPGRAVGRVQKAFEGKRSGESSSVPPLRGAAVRRGLRSRERSVPTDTEKTLNLLKQTGRAPAFGLLL